MNAPTWTRSLLLFALASAGFSLGGCSTVPTPPAPPATVTPPAPVSVDDFDIIDEVATLQRLYSHHRVWHGTPYRMGGSTPQGIDCSAFVQITYRDVFAQSLPRTTSEQVQAGQVVPKSELRAGDLVFFNRGSHVGIYLENRRFLHASTRRGVMISSFDNPYWVRNFWQAIRPKR